MRAAADFDRGAAADQQEQQRPLVEEGFDPERPAADPVPDAGRLDADPADVQEQVTEVGLDEDDPPS